MTNKNNNRNQPHTGGSKADTEFGSEQGLSKKARKQAARDNKRTPKLKWKTLSQVKQGVAAATSFYLF